MKAMPDNKLFGYLISGVISAVVALFGTIIAYFKISTENDTDIKNINLRLIEGNERFKKLESKFTDADGNQRLISVIDCGKMQTYCSKNLRKDIGDHTTRLDKLEKKIDTGFSDVIKAIKDK